MAPSAWRMPSRPRSVSSFVCSYFFFAISLLSPVLALNRDTAQLAILESRGWALGEKIAVECLNRTSETGEHITDETGELQYIPFWKCNETGKPLELAFGSEADINCTIAEIDDPLFHILEFYVHNDAPLSCRIASLAPPPLGTQLASTAYTHIQFALTGVLQLSHLHISPQLNVLLHTTTVSPGTSSDADARAEEEDKKKRKKKDRTTKRKKAAPEGQILAATAYSLPPTEASPKVIIGDPLPLQFSVRWYSARTLPPSTSRLSSGLGGHVHLSTLAYCLLSFGGGVAVSLAYWRGVELPRRIKTYGAQKVGGLEGRTAVSNYGYAYPGTGYANGKRD